MPRRRSRSALLLPIAAVGLVAIGVGALWIMFVPPSGKNGGEAVEQELADLREAEAKRRPAAAPEGGPPLCRRLAAAQRGDVRDGDLDELSGLTASRRTPGLFWAIEDSGADASLAAIRENGSVAGRWAVPGAENVDWEDIATGPGPDGPVLYAADIGDNAGARESVAVYRITEPAAPNGGGSTAPAQRLDLVYPDGPRDAEALIVDPVRGTLLIFSKSTDGAAIYALSSPPFGKAATARLDLVASGPLALATAASVSADGSTVALRGYFSMVVWERRGREPLTRTVRRKPCTPPTGLADGQGEAIALSRGGSTAWTVAEGTNPPIIRLRPR